MNISHKKGDLQFTEDRRNAEITVDLVLQAWANLSDNKVNGPENAIVSEMIKQLPLEKTHCCEVFSGTFHGPDGISKFLEDREIGLLEETGRCPEERDQKLQGASADTGDVEAACILYFSALGEGKEPDNWKNLHVGGVDGISCQHLQVMVTNLPQKHREPQEERNPVLRHGAVVRPTIYLASLDIKSAFR